MSDIDIRNKGIYTGRFLQTLRIILPSHHRSPNSEAFEFTVHYQNKTLMTTRLIPDKPSLQSRHSLDSTRVQEKEAGPLWITLALQKQKGFREQQQSREERRSQRETKLAEKQVRDSVSVLPTPFGFLYWTHSFLNAAALCRLHWSAPLRAKAVDASVCLNLRHQRSRRDLRVCWDDWSEKSNWKKPTLYQAL